jgi:carbonic anhydrase
LKAHVNIFAITIVALSSNLTRSSFATETQQATQPANTAFKKITKAPKADKPADSHDDRIHALAAPPGAIVKPVVTSHPAPGSTKPNETKDAVPDKGHGSGHTLGKGIAADQSLRWLINGNVRFTSKKLRSDGSGSADRQRLVVGQHPHAIVLACSDSRVPPETVFDQALGEIFVIRVAGEALDSSVIASVEYAVEHLGSRLLVVMGHTKCGAVDTALKVKEGTSAGSPDLDRLLADIRPRLSSVSNNKLSPNLEVESTVNADGVARDLLKRSEIVRKKVDAGDLVIKPALYRLDSGKVTFY